MRPLLSAVIFSLASTLVACHQLVNHVEVDTAPDVLSESIHGTWVVEYIGERPVIDRSPARVQFTEEGEIRGNASCNRFFGRYEAQPVLSISPLGSTRMACIPALMEQEGRLLKILPNARSVHFEQGILILNDEHGAQVLRAARDEHTEIE